jgi:hypothetical protein
MVTDLVELASGIPFVPMERTFDLSELSSLRETATPRVSWAVLLMKAYAMVAARRPELRRTYMWFPWPHFYEHFDNACFLAIARNHAGEQRLFYARFDSPEADPLADLQRKFEHYRKAEVLHVKQFRHQIAMSRLPWPLRRLMWWCTLNMSGSGRVHNLGTFGMSLSRIQGADLTYHIAPVTTILGCDPVAENGRPRITLTFDHRVLDGWPAGTVLMELEACLRGPILEEVKGIQGNR